MWHAVDDSRGQQVASICTMIRPGESGAASVQYSHRTNPVGKLMAVSATHRVEIVGLVDDVVGDVVGKGFAVTRFALFARHLNSHVRNPAVTENPAEQQAACRW
jgi:hypothetical protein